MIEFVAFSIAFAGFQPLILPNHSFTTDSFRFLDLYIVHLVITKTSSEIRFRTLQEK